MNKVGEYYADYDEVSGYWGVFHTESAIYFVAFLSREEAEHEAHMRNISDEMGFE